MIKDIHSRQARACTDLASARRWCVSGAPISSDICDMLAQFRFLGFQPFGLKQFFDLHVRRPPTAVLCPQHGNLRVGGLGLAIFSCANHSELR